MTPLREKSAFMARSEKVNQRGDVAGASNAFGLDLEVGDEGLHFLGWYVQECGGEP